MTDIRIERIGGFAGVGLPGSRLKSRGNVALDQLSAGDREAVSRLFEEGPHPAPHGAPDAFRYRLTRTAPGGDTQSVEVPEADMPAALKSAVRDEFD